ncbi:hypothetical protein H5410_028333 [Solanum commersonii]|uniref:Uncharacterized protein n=1 Tax=Solanum commersonii TaxID=4109 RepID=A0A9J5Z1S7_SOLCO|nr:hypothetical protein H5410_028333 [Solanum commersonii]
MTEAFKRLNEKVETLLQENARLMKQVKLLKGKDSSHKVHTGTQTPKLSYPSQDKMDEKDVHSPTNAISSTVSDEKATASPVQTVAEQDKHVIATINPDPSEDRLVPDAETTNTGSRRESSGNNITSAGEDDYGEHSYYQDAQNPNEDDDSGMSFDSEAHNLDT